MNNITSEQAVENEMMLAVEQSTNAFKSAAETVSSKRLDDAVRAMELCEASFKVRAGERGLNKDTPDYKAFRERYNRAATLRTQLCVVGMEVTRGSYSLNYGNPHKHKSRTVGGVRENSLLYRALEVIRSKRIAAFYESHNKKLTPSSVELTEKQWQEIALSQYCVPSKYKIDNGNGPRFTAESAENYLKQFMLDIWEQQSRDASVKDELDKQLNDAGANITPITVSEPKAKKQKTA